MRRSWTDEQMAEAVRTSTTIADVLRAVGLSTSPGNYQVVHVAVQRLGLDTSHWLGQRHLVGRNRETRRTVPLDAILVENSEYTANTKLRQRLIKAGVLEEVCSECGQGPTWNEKPLTLQLDHINGHHRDNRLENLRILCPNCHTQTTSFTSRSPGRYAKHLPPPTCACGAVVSRRGRRCGACAAVERGVKQRKVAWPDAAELQGRVEDDGYAAVGRSLGVSGVAVKKHLKVVRGGVEPPTRAFSAPCSTD